MTSNTESKITRCSANDFIAMAICVSLGIWLFWNHLSGEINYLGNFDRLNAFLSVQRYMIDTLRHQVMPEAWCDQIFLGVNLFGHAGASPDPLLLLLGCLPTKHFVWYAGVMSCGLFILAGWSAYCLLRNITKCVFPALVGALLYQFSYCSVFIMSNMTAYAILIFFPLILLCLRVSTKKSERWAFPVLTISLIYLSYFGHPQFTLYAFVVSALYSVLLASTTKSHRPIIICFSAGVIAVVTSAPRLITVAREMALVGRGTAVSFADTYQFIGSYPREWLRLISGGIFGRCPSEAVSLGNAINLSEGMWIYTSTIAALFVVCGLIRFRGKWLGLVRQKDWDLIFHIFIFVTAIAIVIWPTARFLCYTLFLKLNIVHPRITAIALISFVVIISCLINELIPKRITLTSRQRYIGMCSALLCGFGLFLGVDKLTERTDGPEKIPLEVSPWSFVTTSFHFLMTGSAMPDSLQSPQNLRAFAADDRNVVVEWDPVIGATDYEFSALLNNTSVSTIRWSGTQIVISNLDRNAAYTFTVRAACGDQLSAFAAAVPVVPLVSSDIARLSDPKRYLTTWMSSKELVRIEWSGIALLCALGLIYMKGGTQNIRWIAAHSISFAMVFQALSFADFQMNGKQGKSQYPFDHDNLYAANGDEYRIPAEDTLKQFHDQLEVDHFRSVVVCDPKLIPELSASYFAMFWKLRTAEGYISGVPERIRSLPWPAQTIGYRTVQFNSAGSLPWPLLSLLNVKHALVATNAWHRNAGSDSDGNRADVKPWDIEMMLNPGPPTPREFFAAKVVPVPNAQAAALNLFPDGLVANKIPDVMNASFVEQWDAVVATNFATSISPQATYRGGTIEVDFSAVNEPRFLVLNELYHPDWRAYIGKDIVQIYPTNAYMRGVVIPAGVTHITFQFEPFFRWKNVCIFAMFGGALFLWCMAYFRRDFRHTINNAT